LVNKARLGTDQDELIEDMSVTPEGDLVLTGGFASPFTNENQKALVMKLSENLELFWSKVIYRDNMQDQSYFHVRSIVNDGANTIMVMEATGDIQADLESTWQDIGFVKLNSSGEIVSENMVDIGEYEFPGDLIKSEEGNLFVTGTLYTTPDEFYSSFILSLDAQLEPIFANHHSKEWDDFLMYGSTFISEEPLRIATVGQMSINQQYRGLQTHHSHETGLCTASEMVPTAYDPDFILEEIDPQIYEQEFTITDVEFEITNAINNLFPNCSETLSDELISDSEEISLFPNPCNQSFQISGIQQPTRVSFKDVQGRIINEFTYSRGLIDISAFSEGIYLVEVQGWKTLRLVKQ
jgi:hypothetical protein